MPKVGQRSALRSRLLRVFAGFDACDLPESASAIGSQTFMRLPWRLCEVLAWTKERQDAQPAPSGDRVGPRRSSQKSGLMKDRADRLAQAAQPRPKLECLGRRSDQKVSAPPPQAPSHPA